MCTNLFKVNPSTCRMQMEIGSMGSYPPNFVTSVSLVSDTKVANSGHTWTDIDMHIQVWKEYKNAELLRQWSDNESTYQCHHFAETIFLLRNLHLDKNYLNVWESIGTIESYTEPEVLHTGLCILTKRPINYRRARMKEEGMHLWGPTFLCTASCSPRWLSRRFFQNAFIFENNVKSYIMHKWANC